ncbi:MAG: SDR family NAD(P)-dependent oxidoreductase [Pseudomonadota bacterium]
MADGILTGQHALVTGGGTGIGLACAEALAGAGATVTITGRRLEVLEASASTHPGLHPLTMDVSEEASVAEGFARAATARGAVTICVANAGIAEPSAVAKMELSEWRRTMGINLDGTFLTFRAMLRGLSKTQWARAIAISSIAGLKGLRGAPAYTASKHGMIGLVRGLSADHAGSAMTFNAICPAYVDTDIVPLNIERIMARTGMTEDEARKTMLGANPHGRLIAPQEIGATALWLCSPGAESVNGQSIEVAGGQF